MQHQRAYISENPTNAEEAQSFETDLSTRQRKLLASLSFGLWTVVCWFVLWHNSGMADTFSGTGFTFIAHAEHFILLFGLFAFTGLLFFVNLVFKPAQHLVPYHFQIRPEYQEKLQPGANFWSKPSQFLRRCDPLMITIGSFILWIITFMVVAWQISDHTFSLLHYLLYNNTSSIATMYMQIMYLLIFVFLLITGLVFFLNFWLYSAKSGKAKRQ